MNESDFETRVAGLVNEARAGHVLGVTGHTMRKWRQLGQGPAFVRLSGRCVRYRIEDLQVFLAERVVRPTDIHVGEVRR